MCPPLSNRVKSTASTQSTVHWVSQVAHFWSLFLCEYHNVNLNTTTTTAAGADRGHQMSHADNVLPGLWGLRTVTLHVVTSVVVCSHVNPASVAPQLSPTGLIVAAARRFSCNQCQSPYLLFITQAIIKQWHKWSKTKTSLKSLRLRKLLYQSVFAYCAFLGHQGLTFPPYWAIQGLMGPYKALRGITVP